ncbi:Periplasmic sugar-binding domain protein [Pseudoalteromonas luteoviolacea B = ATCC 29581]|nr:Periplasmic sugar-binding domain protein [Pseudoalteromonas luteoviolacea B = ATCC 29581]
MYFLRKTAFLLFLLCPLFINAANKVVFINPGYEVTNPTGPFWQNVSRMMQAASADLNFDLSIRYAERNYIQMKKLVSQALSENPDYLILVDEKSIIFDTLMSLKPTQTQLYFLLNRPSSIEIARLESKGYRVLGSVIANNTKVGRALMKSMLTASDQSKGSMFALLGDTITSASIERERGMLGVMNRQHQIRLRERIYANWSEQEAFDRVLGLAQRYPDLVMIWSANDAMAAGAERALRQLNLRDKVIIGGINWDPQYEQLDMSFGGHFALGAYALIRLNDFRELNQLSKDHEELEIFVPYSEKFAPLLKSVYSDQLEKINFRQFSQTSDTPLAFGIEHLLYSLEKNF